MSAERDLLRRAKCLLECSNMEPLQRQSDNIVEGIKELLAQPEQEPEPLLAETKIEWYGKGFRQGVNEFAPPKPLTEDVIYALDKEGIVENMDDHQVRYVIRWIRRVEKAHGIGGEI